MPQQYNHRVRKIADAIEIFVHAKSFYISIVSATVVIDKAAVDSL